MHSGSVVFCREPRTEGNDIITGTDAVRTAQYSLEWKSGSQEYATDRSMTLSGSDNVSTDLTGLNGDTSYTVRVFAAKDAEDGPASDEASNTTLAARAPGKVTGLSVTPAPVYDQDLHWTAPEGSVVTSYSVKVSQDGETWETITADTGNDQTWYTHVSSHIDEVLHYWVRARNSFSSGPWSGTASAETSTPANPGPAPTEARSGA